VEYEESQMFQGSYRTHLDAAQGDPRGREARRVDIYDAMQVLKAEHGVSEIAAYTRLVEASVDACSSVRETAARVLAESSDTDDESWSLTSAEVDDPHLVADQCDPAVREG
jgi:hypothetical protein